MIDKLVEIRTWPQQLDLQVIDVLGARQIAHYPVDLQREEPLTAASDPLLPYRQRAEAARELLQQDQEFLQLTFQQDQPVQLQIDNRPRELADGVLSAYGLDLEAVELANSQQLLAEIESRFSLSQLFSLLIDWHDVVELHRYRGYSEADPAPWIKRSEPGNCFLFHYLSQGELPAEQQSNDRAEETFTELINGPAADYSLGIFLRWLYYSQAEFPNHPRRPLQAAQELKINLQ